MPTFLQKNDIQMQQFQQIAFHYKVSNWIAIFVWFLVEIPRNLFEINFPVKTKCKFYTVRLLNIYSKL